MIGFQTKPFRENFLSYLRDELGIDTGYDGVIEAFGRRTIAGVFPISIDTEEFSRFASAPLPPATRGLEESLQGRALAISVDRLIIPKEFRSASKPSVGSSSTSGISQEIRGVADRAKSRETIPEYATVSREVAEVFGRISGRHGEIHWVPLVYVNRYAAFVACRTLSAARVGVGTPLRDGMNLVAKEYVAAQSESDPAS